MTLQKIVLVLFIWILVIVADVRAITLTARCCFGVKVCEAATFKTLHYTTLCNNKQHTKRLSISSCLLSPFTPNVPLLHVYIPISLSSLIYAHSLYMNHMPPPPTHACITTHQHWISNHLSWNEIVLSNGLTLYPNCFHHLFFFYFF